MSPSGVSFSEQDRLEALHSLELLDTPRELEYDQLVHLASQICTTPISLVSLVDMSRQWFKASVGFKIKETPRDVSFCTHAIDQDGPFVVEDASSDTRFKDNILVTESPSIRFYAGVPIRAPGGAPVGTLCVIDTKPRALTENQCRALAILGQQVEARMKLRQQRIVLENALVENRRLNENLQSTNAMFQAFMDNGPFMSYVKDSSGRFVYYNKSMAMLFNLRRDQWLGKSDHDLFPAEFAEITPVDHGRQIHWRSYKFPIDDGSGKSMLAGLSLDVTESLLQGQALAAANIELERLATIDPLTGLFNRRVFQTRIEIEFAIVQRKARPLSLMILDMDNFKKLNDGMGHASGDRALKVLGDILRACTRKEDLAARLGGEEFAVLMPDTKGRASMALADRIHRALRGHDDAPAPLTVSIGIASTDAAMTSWEQLFGLSDEAMYTAKRSGKDRTVIHPPQQQLSSDGHRPTS
jgi:diguanylate cyclase (GGDEF)-like protein